MSKYGNVGSYYGSLSDVETRSSFSFADPRCCSSPLTACPLDPMALQHAVVVIDKLIYQSQLRRHGGSETAGPTHINHRGRPIRLRDARPWVALARHLGVHVPISNDEAA